ncbi:MAG: pyridoxal phosphate-dependent aminotransferase [Candidatus Nealsonbacteria bacterium]|nr:pyridoxal phosphate-dependent aminotransferase [Candidatus Nealsonbacteria bacterium]
MEKFALSGYVEAIEPSTTFVIDAKVKELQKQGVKVYNFCLGEPDFTAPGNIKSAAIKAIVDNKTRYTQIRGVPELLEAICEKFKKDNNLFYNPKEIIVSNGAKQILYLAVRTICGVGDEVIVLAPYWVSYPTMPKLGGGAPVIVKTDNFRFSAKDVEKAITKKTKAIIINSPNNPTSIVWTRKELEELANLVLKYKILVISDEIYEKFLYSGAKHFSFASLDPKLKDYAITVNGVSKTYAMTGFRIGYCGAPDYIVEKMAELQSHVSSSICSISQVAAVEALLGEQESVQKMAAEFDARRRFV